MFRCCCKYYKNFFQTNLLNGGLYIDILNETHLPIFFIVQYTVDVRTFTKQSPVFGFGKSERIQISHSAVNTCFNVLDNSTNPPRFICNVVLAQRKKSCYKLIPAHASVQLVQVPC